jgi:hypothetical protein
MLRRAARPVARPGADVEEAPLFASAVSLDPARHSAHVWRPPKDLGFARHLGALPLALTEVLRAAAFLPMAIAAGPVPRPMVVMSAMPGTPSPLIREGRILGRHVPAILRFYPFLPMPGAADGVPGGDPEGGLLLQGQVSAGWHPVFGPDGALSAPTAERVAALATWQKGRQAALAAARALSEAGVLCPAPVLSDDTWLSVDPDRLMGLPAAQVAALNRSGAMALGYALMTAASHLPSLVESSGTVAPRAAATSSAASGFIAAFAQAGAETDSFTDGST